MTPVDLLLGKPTAAAAAGPQRYAVRLVDDEPGVLASLCSTQLLGEWKYSPDCGRPPDMELGS